MEKGTVQSFCQNCHMKCRVFVAIRDGEIQSIANAMHIEGIKATQAHEEIFHPDRVVYPQRRVGEKGEGKRQRVSWDEALGTMAERFGQIKERHGVEAIATIRG